MIGKKRLIAAIFLMPGIVPVALALRAQEVISLADQAEQILERDEQSDVPSAVFEAFLELEDHPLNLNTATAEQMEYAGIFTSFQVRQIIEYRERYGDFISVYELSSIRGFRPGRVKEISRFIKVESGNSPIPVKKGTNTMLLFAGRTFPTAAGYQNFQQEARAPPYEGSPWKTSLKVHVSGGKRITSGLVYEKDPGEKGFSGSRPQFLNGFIQYRANRIFEQCILGSYRLQNGLGLVQGMDQFTSPGASLSRLLKLSSLKPYAGLSESGTHRGLACRLNLNPVKISIWSSLKNMDMSTTNLPPSLENVEWESHLRETGLHRTGTEMGGRGLAYQGNAGIQALVSYKTLFAGAQFSLEACGLTKKGADSLHADTHPVLHQTMSIYWKWKPGRIETFGEYSPGRNETSAILTGIRVHLNDYLGGGLLAHWYGTAHRETFSSAYASGSSTSNEKGLMIHIHAEPSMILKADLAAELFWYPAPRYQSSIASSGLRFNLTLQSCGQEPFQWRIRMIKKIWQTTPETDQRGYRPLVQHILSRMDGRLIFQASKKIQWQTRLVASWLAPDRSIQAYAALLQIRIHPLNSIRLITQFVVFDIPVWTHRIYMYEPGLYHQFSFPALYGKGQKLNLVLSLKPCTRLRLEGKLSRIVYHDRNQIGSGNDLLEGSKKSEIGIQLRLKF